MSVVVECGVMGTGGGDNMSVVGERERDWTENCDNNDVLFCQKSSFDALDK